MVYDERLSRGVLAITGSLRFFFFGGGACGIVCWSIAFIVCVYLVPSLCLGRASFICILFLFCSFLYAPVGVGGWWYDHLRWDAFLLLGVLVIY